MNKKKLASLALVCVLTLGLLPALASVARADGASTTYTLTIPATLDVAKAGWNATDGITANNATNDFDTGKKLTVTAASANSWALKSGDNSIGYNLVTADGTYSSEATPASWEFSADELNVASGGTNKTMGIVVEDYSSKPAGTYQDTVTFTAKVESASLPGIALSAVTSDYIGSVVTTDGYVYATVADATSASKTVVAVIVYVGATGDATYNNGLALALADESSNRMTPENSITAAAAHTPSVAFGTWVLASEAQWNLMINARGSDALRDVFNGAGGTNLINDFYWSSTQSGNKYRRYDFDEKEWYNGNSGATNGFARACLVF